MSETQTTEAQVTDTDTEVTDTDTEVIEPNPNRIWFRNDYSRAIVFIRTGRQARYGAPWDAKDNPTAEPAIDAMAQTLASAFAQDNPFFDADKFLAATQLPAKPVLPEGAFDASEADDDDELGELAALLADDAGDDA
jgi:hypothetical protein